MLPPFSQEAVDYVLDAHPQLVRPKSVRVVHVTDEQLLDWSVRLEKRRAVTCIARRKK